MASAAPSAASAIARIAMGYTNTNNLKAALSSRPNPMSFEPRTVKAELRLAAKQLLERGLYQSAKWASEQAAGIGTVGVPPHAPSPALEDEPIADELEEDKFLMARSYFELKEFKRAGHALKGCRSQKCTFLRGYALYLAGEKRKEEEVAELTAAAQTKSDVVNGELAALSAELGEAHKLNQLDGFNLYLYGVVLKESEHKAQARDVLVASIDAYPWNWSAWLELAALCPDRQTAELLAGAGSKPEYMKDMFLAHVALEFQNSEESLALYESLQQLFPLSNYLLAQTAIAKYNQREFDEAQEEFEELVKREPCRLDGMDIYSNILYVKESRAPLSFLAHTATQLDKYRPETCCIVGNYYSLRGQHEKAVIYFQRALRLNRNYLSAWTLMGHEYVEMKNTPAAIHAYRTAVDINARDYRAWYGLGQTYELLHMPFYALYYYRKATTLRPYDARMWCAMADCYEKMQRWHEAIKCYERAECHSDREGIALSKLARLYCKQLNMADKAAFYYKRNLDKRDAEELDGQETVEALLFLANFHRARGDLKAAEAYCSRLLDYAGPEKEEAKALLRDMRSEQGQRRGLSAKFSP
eukprot:tig00021127_g18680.t1